MTRPISRRLREALPARETIVKAAKRVAILGAVGAAGTGTAVAVTADHGSGKPEGHPQTKAGQLACVQDQGEIGFTGASARVLGFQPGMKITAAELEQAAAQTNSGPCMVGYTDDEMSHFAAASDLGYGPDAQLPLSHPLPSDGE